MSKHKQNEPGLGFGIFAGFLFGWMAFAFMSFMLWPGEAKWKCAEAITRLQQIERSLK